jgi:hypothetical protein
MHTDPTDAAIVDYTAAEKEEAAAGAALRVASAAHRRATRDAVAELRAGLRPDDPLDWWFALTAGPKAAMDAAGERVEAARAARHLAAMALQAIEAAWPAERRALRAQLALLSDEVEVLTLQLALGGARLERDAAGRIASITTKVGA